MESNVSESSCGSSSPGSTGGAGNFALREELYEYGIHDAYECPKSSSAVTEFK